MAFPVNTIMLSGYGDGGSYKFLDPAAAWADLGQPASTPANGTGGCCGMATYSSGEVVHTGGTFGAALTRSFNTDFTVDATIPGADNEIGQNNIACDGAGYCYHMIYTGGSFDKIAKALPGDTSWTVVCNVGYTVSPSSAVGPLAVNQAGTIAYFSSNHHRTAGGTLTVYKVDLGTGTQTTFKASAINSNGTNLTSILVLSDDSVVICWGANTAAGCPIRYDSSGTILNTYNSLPDTYSLATGIALAYTSLGAVDSTAFFLGYYSAAPGYGVTLAKVTVATGATTTSYQTPNDGFEYDGPFTALRTVTVATIVLAPIPSPTTPGPQTPCDPQAQVSGGGIGNAGCSVGGVGRDPVTFASYGSVPVHADATDGELLAGKSAVDLWIEWHHVNAGVTTTIRRSLVELADDPSYHGGRKAASLIDVGDFEHGLGNEGDSFEAADCIFRFSDVFDRWIRTQLGDQELEGDEVEFYLASPAARAAGSVPRVLMRAVVQSPTLEAPLQAAVTAVDLLFSIFGPLGRFPRWPFWTIGDVFPTAPADVAVRTLPWLYGPKTDKGAKDPITNLPAEKGMVPLHYVGQINLASSESSTSVGLPTTFDNAIGVPGQGVLGMSPGGWNSDGTVTNDPYHAFVRVTNGVMGGPWSPGRASTPSPFGTSYGFRNVIDDGPGLADYYISFQIPADLLSWDPTQPVPAGRTDIRYQIVKTAENPYSDITFIAYWPDPTSGLAWNPQPTTTTSTPTTTTWDWYLAFGHAIYMGAGWQLKASDLGGGNPTNKHDRTGIDIDSRNGSDILAPWNADGSVSSAWTAAVGASTYIDYVGANGKTYRCTMFGMRGPISDDHKNGVVNATLNVPAGIEDVGDGTGDPIVALHDVEQHWLENPILGFYTSGLWVTNSTAPKWPDGTYKVRSTRFAARQAFTVTKLGGIGLEASWYVGEAKDIKAHVSDFNMASETALGVNGHSQFSLGYLDETVDPSTLPAFEHSLDVFGKIATQTGVNRETVNTFACDWDPDAQKFRLGPIPLENSLAVAKLAKGNFDGRKAGQPVQSPILYREDHLRWVGTRRLLRLGPGLIVVTIPGSLRLWDFDVDSDGIVFTTIEGRGTSGYVSQPMQLRRRKFSLTNKRICTYTAWDIKDVLLATKYTNGLTRRSIVSNSSPTVVTNDATQAPLVLS